MKSAERPDKISSLPVGRYYPKRINRYHISPIWHKPKPRHTFNFVFFPEKLLRRKRNLLYLACLLSFFTLIFILARNPHQRDKVNVKIFFHLPFFVGVKPQRFRDLAPSSSNAPNLEFFSWNSNETQKLIKEAQDIYITYHPMFNNSSPEGEFCRISHQDPFDSAIVSLIQRPKPIYCNGSTPKLFTTDSDFLVGISAPERFNLTNCCYNVIQRKDDFQSEISESCNLIEKERTQIPYEFIQVHCDTIPEEGKPMKRIPIDTFVFTPPLQRNSELPKAEATSQYNKPEFHPEPNVILIILSSISRMGLYRTMPSTVVFLNNNLNAFEFTKFSKTGSDFSSLLALLTGQSVEQSVQKWGTKEGSSFDNCPFIWQKFASQGYTTLFAEDDVTGSFNNKKPGFWTQPTHYYFRAASLSAKGFCLGTKLIAEKVFEYSQKLTMSSKKFFQVLHFSSLTKSHESGAVNLDEIFRKNFELLYPHLNNTVLIFLSTQGMNTGDLRQTFRGSMEERNPFLFYVLPDWLENKFDAAFKNVFENQNKFTTAFDVHETLKDLSNLKIDPTNLVQRQRAATQFINRQLQAFKNLEKFKIQYAKASKMFKDSTGIAALEKNKNLNVSNPLGLNFSTLNLTARYEYPAGTGHQTRWNATYTELLYLAYIQKLEAIYTSKLGKVFGKSLQTEPDDALEAKENSVDNLIVKSRNGMSHFLNLPPDRECEFAGIDNHSCPCMNLTPVNIFNGSGLLHAGELASAVIKTIHKIFYSYNLMLTPCSYLKVSKVLHLASAKSGNETESKNYRVVFQVAPGGGIFEATARKFKREIQISGISRLDFHQKQSYCLGIQELKKFCVCGKNPLKIQEIQNARPIDLEV